MSDQKPMENTFDFIVVGGGAAGCVTAEKLSRHSSCLLLEAGGDDVDPSVQQHDQWFTCATKEELTLGPADSPASAFGLKTVEPEHGQSCWRQHFHQRDVLGQGQSAGL